MLTVYIKIVFFCYLKTLTMWGVYMKKFIVFSSSVLLFASLSFTQTTLNEAVDFTETDTKGESHNLFSYLTAGNYVLLEFTSMW